MRPALIGINASGSPAKQRKELEREISGLKEVAAEIADEAQGLAVEVPFLSKIVE